jgi:glycosyltransferase involved in cell wall biosynthesis
MPRVSICLPTRNRSRTLGETICAMLAQTFRDWELIVGDDASTDDTADVVASFSDTRIRYVRHPRNLGIYQNWNSLIPLCRGEYVAIYHDHDIYLPTIVEKSCALLDRNPRMAFVHTAIVLLGVEHEPLALIVRNFDAVVEGKAFQHEQIDHSCVTAATAMVRRSAYEKVGEYDLSYGLSADVEMWLRLAEGEEVGYVREPQALILARSPAEAAITAGEELLCQRRINREWVCRVYGSGASCVAAQVRLRKNLQIHILRAALRASFYLPPERFGEAIRALAACSLLPISTWLRLVGRFNVLRGLLREVAARAARLTLETRREVALNYCRANDTICSALKLNRHVRNPGNRLRNTG